MRREYCCSKCGLIWFNEYGIGIRPKCPECENPSSIENPIYACDTYAWFYSHKAIESLLKSQDKKLHYHEKHSLYTVAID